MTKTQKEVT